MEISIVKVLKHKIQDFVKIITVNYKQLDHKGLSGDVYMQSEF